MKTEYTIFDHYCTEKGNREIVINKFQNIWKIH